MLPAPVLLGHYPFPFLPECENTHSSAKLGEPYIGSVLQCLYSFLASLPIKCPFFTPAFTHIHKIDTDKGVHDVNEKNSLKERCISQK